MSEKDFDKALELIEGARENLERACRFASKAREHAVRLDKPGVAHVAYKAEEAATAALMEATFAFDYVRGRW